MSKVPTLIVFWPRYFLSLIAKCLNKSSATDPKRLGPKSPGGKRPGPKCPVAKRPGTKRPGPKCPGAKRPGPKSPGPRSQGAKRPGPKSRGETHSWSNVQVQKVRCRNVLVRNVLSKMSELNRPGATNSNPPYLKVIVSSFCFIS